MLKFESIKEMEYYVDANDLFLKTGLVHSR